jgi:hypothetical protein
MVLSPPKISVDQTGVLDLPALDALFHLPATSVCFWLCDDLKVFSPKRLGIFPLPESFQEKRPGTPSVRGVLWLHSGHGCLLLDSLTSLKLLSLPFHFILLLFPCDFPHTCVSFQ